jgi:radical SAM superfamily enzyme YgiQ (UPF0313 family)
LLIVGYESGDQKILKNIKKGATVERARQFTKDCQTLDLAIPGDFIPGLPRETYKTINHTIAFAKELDVETIQVSVAHAHPGTELCEYVVKNGFKMVDNGEHQLATSNIRAFQSPKFFRQFTISTMSGYGRKRL